MMNTFNVTLFLLLASYVWPVSVSNGHLYPDSLASDHHLGKRLTRRSTEHKAISFKNVANQEQVREFRVKHQPVCDDIGGKLGYCTEDPEYDEAVVQRFKEILKNSALSSFIIDVFKETIVAQIPGLETRDGFVSEQTPCPSRESIIYPRRGKSANDDWVFILQDFVKQGVKVEKCVRTGSECQFGGGGLPHTACRQKYIYKKLLTMDATGSDIVSESVFLPSCCVCYVSSDFISTKISPRCLPTA